MKECSVCGGVYKLDFFYKDKNCRYGRSSSCIPCAREKAILWRQENPERKKVADDKWRRENRDRYLENAARWQREHPERVKVKNAKWHQENREKVLKDSAEWYAKNKERALAANAKWRRENSEIAKTNTARWRLKNKDKVRAYGRKWQKNNLEYSRKVYRERRARIMSVEEKFTAENERETLARFNHKCANCGTIENLAIDHHLPLSKGYALAPDNAVVLCRSCNASKNAKWPDEFYLPDKLMDIEVKLWGQGRMRAHG